MDVLEFSLLISRYWMSELFLVALSCKSTVFCQYSLQTLLPAVHLPLFSGL